MPDMYWYVLVGLLAAAALIIVNYDVLFHRGDSQKFPGLGTYRKFLYGIMSYYITDILWGVLDSLHLTTLLFVDTVVYYVAMAVGVLFWAQYVVMYLAEENAFSRFLAYTGRIFFASVVAITVINCFTPVLFWFDENGAYHACPARHIQLVVQILLFLLTSAYTFRAMLRTEGAAKKRYRAICLSGLVVAFLLLVQVEYPFLPLYTVGYMLGSTLLHTFVVSDEIEEYRQAINVMLRRQSELAAAANEAKSSFLANMSHEIRTPINAVLGMNEMILRESSEKNIIEYAGNIRTAGSTLLGLVNDLLNFSKIDTNDGANSHEPLPEQKTGRETFTAPEAAILVVDDTPMNLTVFRGLLKNTRIQIDAAESGSEGLKLTKEKKYDLIVLDHMMPEKDGIETLHELRADLNNPNLKTPVVCLTANAISGAQEMYLSEGFDEYLTKPIECADLEAAILRFLPPEKVTIQEASEAGENAPEERTELMNFYASVPELNYGDAVRFCANEEVLKETLEQFYRAIKPNIKAIDGFLTEKDYKNYTIRVHALKSSARLIGAEALSADARHLEDLGNSLTDKDIESIGELTPKLLADYQRFLELLSPLYAAEEAAREAAPEISIGDLNEAYDAIRQFVESFDIDAIDNFISEIRKYRIPKLEKSKFSAIEECVRNMDWIGLDEALKG